VAYEERSINSVPARDPEYVFYASCGALRKHPPRACAGNSGEGVTRSASKRRPVIAQRGASAMYSRVVKRHPERARHIASPKDVTERLMSERRGSSKESIPCGPRGRPRAAGQLPTPLRLTLNKTRSKRINAEQPRTCWHLWRVELEEGSTARYRRGFLTFLT
jgi:hypothetical protein